MAFIVLLVGAQRKVDVLCLREHETTLVESMYRLMEIIIGAVPSFERHYVVRHNHILGVNGTQIRFRGLSESTGTARGVKSLEGIDICVLEEAAYLSIGALNTLIPTIRKAGSIMFALYNQRLPDDAIHVRAEDPEPDWLVMDVSWKDNPFLSEAFHTERRYIKRDGPGCLRAHLRWCAGLRLRGAASLLTHDRVEAALARYSAAAALAADVVDIGFDIADVGPDRCSVCLRRDDVVGPWQTWSGVGSNLTRSTEPRGGVRP